MSEVKEALSQSPAQEQKSRWEKETLQKVLDKTAERKNPLIDSNRRKYSIERRSTRDPTIELKV